MKLGDYEAVLKRLSELEKKLNGGLGSGNFGHSGRPGKVGGSGKTSAGSLARGRAIKGVRSYNPEHDIDGGFTVNLNTGEAKTLGNSDGYAVGGFGTEMIVSREDWEKNSEKIIRDYWAKNRKLLDQSEYYLGGWVPTKNSTNDKSIVGKVVLDVSRVFSSKKEAAKAAVKFDQDSITDFKSADWPTKEDLAKEFGLEKELAKSAGKRAEERSQK